jgi:hypothetical protein
MGWVVNASPLSLYTRETDSIPIVREAGWVPGSVQTGTESLIPIGIRFPDHPAHRESTVQSIYCFPKLVHKLNGRFQYYKLFTLFD